ncbi:hypothetical protein G3N56_03820 [Desulfovibrio sulfodismutans]|uniref:Uracil-DNA glycosylase-like domain-containing protein n=1 Tax=Desulfolutivibrio sulfodismutans TaxID=63561 RepID=A0A7K3NKZ0_9BACT|nr:hypothetical protein [Desulfolutivibrio sulfodismutans]NDY55869.1 hypothetical protein [Desulfolutivibrio sulfodismutans]QLA14271.1 hypothetical protein GD606_19360 [Desulfolutivibrio sulfodismutans DSM 3696]
MADHPSIELFKKCTEITGKSYPGVVEAIPEQLGCTAFFPGGYGLWLEEENNSPDTLPDFPVNGVMLLADIFDSYDAYCRLHDEYHLNNNVRCSNIDGRFWAGLRDIVKKSGCGFAKIFFSNVYMGIFHCEKTYFHKKAKINKEYIDSCNEFLLQQILMQQPKLIFAVGLKSAECLGSLFNVQTWKNPSIASMNGPGTFSDSKTYGDVQFKLGYIADPTYPVNENKRTYGDEEGRNANVKFFTEALSLSNIS